MLIDHSNFESSSKPLKEKSAGIEYETIFDHNITEEELEKTYITNANSKKEYLKMIDYNQDQSYLDLAHLYNLRNDKKTADKYDSMVSDGGKKKENETYYKLVSEMGFI